MFKHARLELSRLLIDLTNLFKIFQYFTACNIYYALSFYHASNNTRGHCFKHVPYRTYNSCFKYFFTNRIINVWNFSRDNCFNTNLTKCFKSKLTKIDVSRFIMAASPLRKQ